MKKHSQESIELAISYLDEHRIGDGEFNNFASRWHERLSAAEGDELQELMDQFILEASHELGQMWANIKPFVTDFMDQLIAGIQPVMDAVIAWYQAHQEAIEEYAAARADGKVKG